MLQVYMAGREDVQHHEALKCPTLTLSSFKSSVNKMPTSTSAAFNTST